MKIRSERGAAVVEFAVILPLLLVILFGIVEFGFVFYNKALITNASREGARYGALYRATTDTAARAALKGKIEDRIENYLKGRLISFGDDEYSIEYKLVDLHPEPPVEDPVEVPVKPMDLLTNDYFLVRVKYNYSWLLIDTLIPPIDNSINLSGTTTMRVE